MSAAPAILSLCRLHYTLPFALTYALTVYYAAGGLTAQGWTATALSTTALALVLAGAYALNDAFDAEVDRRAVSFRPVAAGKVRRRTAAWLGALLMAGGLALATAGRWPFLVALAAVAAGLVFYDATSKRLGVFKPVVVAALMTSIYPLSLAQAGGAFGARAATLAVFPAWMFLTSYGYSILKDLRDAAADQHATARPTALQRRPAAWRRVANAALLVGAALLIGPAFLGCRWLYAVIVPGAVAACVVAVFLPTRQAIRAVYVECVLVGLAATVDVAMW